MLVGSGTHTHTHFYTHTHTPSYPCVTFNRPPPPPPTHTQTHKYSKSSWHLIQQYLSGLCSRTRSQTLGSNQARRPYLALEGSTRSLRRRLPRPRLPHARTLLLARSLLDEK